MKKIPTVFVRDPDDRRYVTDEVSPGCEWVLAGEGVPTRKYDGTCVMLDDDGEWWARREVKPGKAAPANFQPVEHDKVTGKTMGWEPIAQSSFAKYHAEALGHPYERRHVGTYELIGPKINGDPEGVGEHQLVPHADADLMGEFKVNGRRDFETITGSVRIAATIGAEGIVWHHPDGRMAKLKARDLRPS